jgi:2-polyprenyl-3-methyl-5-hydroxy-6-metoxy-1,4-benzoquinol methylase
MSHDKQQVNRAIESEVVGMYSDHPSPSIKDKIAFASSRMELRLFCCGVTENDYVGKTVLDAGCGTGEYSCWFATQGACVTGIDLSLNSLKEAREYTNSIGLDSVYFERRSVLETGLSDSSFDFVYCTGVLHHTPDPYGGFEELCRVLRSGGKILISLYNLLGFAPRELRRQITKLLGGKNLDSRVYWGNRLFPFTARRLTRGRRNDPQSALYDYFAVPHESLHTFGEILNWFDQVGLEYTGSFPPALIRDYPAMFAHRRYLSVEKQFQSWLGRLIRSFVISPKMRRTRPDPLSRALVQMIWLVSGIGVFSICGRK